ncbi:MAG: ABC transporter substrate-binding protein [Oscillospiraceae bacterium]|nr:ABC transporter substrate-binding protein [Oscillospiraceae bacterium]
MRRLLSLALVCALCLPLAGCLAPEPAEPEAFWEVSEPDVSAPDSAAEEPVFTLPYLSSQTLDPIACSDGVQQVVGSLLYEGLFALDEGFSAENALCASYAVSANGLTYTFALRGDAAFSDGSPLTAADVLAAYRRAKASERYAARFANIVAMRVSREAFVVTLLRADSALPALLDIPIVKSGTEKDAVPLGTGAYRFVSGEGGAYLARSESWWGDGGGLPERIALSPAKDADTAVYLFSARRAHLLTADLLGDTPAASLGGVALDDADTTALLFLGFNTRSAALADKTLRAAMGAALDRETVAATLLAGHARAAQFPISPASPLYPAALEAAYAPDAYAAALEARRPSGAKAPTSDAPLELTLLVNEENTFKTALADYLAQALTKSYLSVTPVALPWAEYLDALKNRRFDLWLGEVRLTADWNLAPLIGAGGALNYGGYADAATDAALAAFLADESEATAAALCERLAAETPLLPIAFKSVSVLTPAGLIDGVSPTATRPLRALERWGFQWVEE